MNSPLALELLERTAAVDPQERADAEIALQALLSRQSHWPLMSPGPDDRDLTAIFDAALRAPDHGRLRPWRFVVVREWTGPASKLTAAV